MGKSMKHEVFRKPVKHFEMAYLTAISILFERWPAWWTKKHIDKGVTYHGLPVAVDDSLGYGIIVVIYTDDSEYTFCRESP
jgi:hypothetical protein